MSKMIDLTGQKFNKWTVIERDKTKKGTAYWICQCECGTIKSVCGSSLRNGSSKSCGCERIKKSRENNGKFINEIGNRYGKLLVIAKDEELSIQKHRAQWICKCDCGNFKTVSSKCLRDGKTQSCGCITSIGESNIQKILTENNINYIPQYGVIIEEKRYRYDFALLDNNDNIYRLIEFDGIQHYDKNHKHWGKDIEIIQIRDNIKNKYAKEKNISLIRIPYKNRDNITLEMLLGDEYLINENSEI